VPVLLLQFGASATDSPLPPRTEIPLRSESPLAPRSDIPWLAVLSFDGNAATWSSLQADILRVRIRHDTWPV
jgi:hypothetical protein